MWYILDENKNPVHLEGSTQEIMEKLAKYETQRIIAKTRIEDQDVSTVFLFLDHNHMYGKPALFETMIFGGPYAEYQNRYSTFDEAVAGHNKVVEALIDKQSPYDIE